MFHRTPNTSPSRKTSDYETSSADKPSYSSVENSQIYNSSDLLHFRKMREVYELEIATLEQKKEALQNEYQKLQANAVPKAELVFLKANIRSNVSEASIANIIEANEKYTELRRELCAMKNQEELLEREIQKELKKRKELENQEETEDIFNGIDVEPSIQLTAKPTDGYKTENRQLAQLVDTQNELKAVIQAKPSTTTQIQAASAFADLLRAQKQYHDVSSKNLQKSVSALKKELSIAQIELTRTKQTIENETVLIQDKEHDFKVECNEIENRNSTLVEKATAEIDFIDKEIEKTKEEIERAKALEESFPVVDFDLEVSEDEEEDFSDYEKQAEQLREEVKNMKKDYYRLKASAIKRDKRLKEEIAREYKKYSMIKSAIMTSPIRMARICNSPISEHINSLISRVDAAIAEAF